MTTTGSGVARAELRSLALLLDGLTAQAAGRSGHARFRFQQVIHLAKDGGGRSTSSLGEPSLEAARAWRGLAEQALADGDVITAEAHLKTAVSVYRELARLSPGARVRAQEGEAEALMLGGELMVRRGLVPSAETLFGRARTLLERLGDDRSAEAWAASGRLARQAGDAVGAESAFTRALARYEQAGNLPGHAEVLLELALLKRRTDRGSVLRMLDLAAKMARDTGRAELLARVLIARGRTLEDDASAQDAYLEAVQWAVEVGARALAGLALVGFGSRGGDGGERPLLGGAQTLLDAEHYPGLGLALLRVGEHAVRVGDPELALAAAEAAWRVFRSLDPIEGLGRVLRVVERAFVLQRLARPLLVVCYARAALVGREDPSALQLRDHYAARSPSHWLTRLAGATRDQLVAEARRVLQAAILPSLRHFGLAASSFATAQGALDVLGVMAGVSPRGAARQLAPWTPQPQPSDLPEPKMPPEVLKAMEEGTVVRIDVPLMAQGGAAARRGRTPVYDPEGRLADMVASTLRGTSDLEGEGGPWEAGARRRSTPATDPVAAWAELEGLFPDDLPAAAPAMGGAAAGGARRDDLMGDDDSDVHVSINEDTREVPSAARKVAWAFPEEDWATAPTTPGEAGTSSGGGASMDDWWSDAPTDPNGRR